MIPEMPPSGETVAEQYINQWPGTGKGSKSGVESPNTKGYTGKWDSFFEEPTSVARNNLATKNADEATDPSGMDYKQLEDLIENNWYRPDEPDILCGVPRTEGAGDKVTYRRVQGGSGNNASRQRINVNPDGSISRIF